MTEESPRLPNTEERQKIGQTVIAIADAEGKYVYYLLATASAAIFVAIQRTEGEGFRQSQIRLGLALLCWIASFVAGCVNRQSVISKSTESFYADMAKFFPFFLRAEARSKEIELPEKVIQEMDGIWEKIVREREAESHKAHVAACKCYQIQAPLLVLGGVCFLIWHLIDMGLRTQ